MDEKVVLCADTESLKNPAFVGLEGENLDAQKWLRVFCSALEARSYLQKSKETHEVWVASSDDVDPINLAAALKKDSHDKGVFLVAFQDSGSLKSRASAAGIDATLSQQDFVTRYVDFKQKRSVTIEKMLSNVDMSHIIPAAQEQAQVTSPVFKAQATPGKAAHVLSVMSASGGAGKSTVAALSALFSQGLGYRTLLLDADLQFGDMRYFLGESKPLTIDALVKDPGLMAQLNPRQNHPALLAAPERLEESEVIGAQISAILETLKSSFDVIVVNTGAFWTDQHIALIEKSTTVLFLVDQRSSSLRACKHALDLCSRCGVALNPFLPVVNRCGRNAPLTSIDVSCALQGMHTIELAEGGREVADLLGLGMPFELIHAKNNLCISIEKMLLEVLPHTDRLLSDNAGKGKPKKEPRSRRRKRRAACL